jgi:hypothetical protein
VHELLTWSVTRPGADRGVMVGEPIGGELPHASASQNVTLNTPDNRQQSVTAEADAAGIRWSYSDTDLSGVYSVAGSTEADGSTTTAAADRLFSVNVDTREGDLSRIDASDLPPQFVTSERSDLDETAATAVARHTGMHRSLLYLVLSLLLFESILAWRFGNAGK